MKKYIPNIITIIRASLIVPIIIFTLLPYKYIAGILFIIAILTDFLDGYLARKWDVCSEFGRKADPIIDKYLSISILFVIVINKFINIFILIMELLIMFLNRYIYKQKHNNRPIRIDKIKKFLLSFYIILILFNIYYLPLFFLVAVLETIVFIFYINKTE